MKLNNLICKTALSAVALLMAVGASAQSVSVSRVSGYYVPGSDGEFNVAATVGAGYNANVLVGGGYETFCVSRDTSITIPGTYLYAIDSSAPISVGTAWLYSQFAKGTLAGYRYLGYATVDSSNPLHMERENDAYNLQLAIWTLEGQYSSLTNPPSNNPFLNAAIAAFGGDINAAAAPNSPGGYGVGVLDLNFLTGAVAQPMLVLLPPVQPASIGDYIWQDNNTNGIQDAGEPGITGASVALSDCSGAAVVDINGIPVNPYVTTANGFYTFTNLPPGGYKITVTLPSGYVFTKQYAGSDTTKDSNVNPANGISDCVTLVAGQYDKTVDAGAYIPAVCKASVCGSIFADCDGSGDLTSGDVGLKAVLVKLLTPAGTVVGSTTTDTNGSYCFGGLAAGNYVVSVTPPAGYKQTAASTGYHWKDCYGRVCWSENDGNAHCVNSGTECWLDRGSNLHWKDGYGRDCWKDNSGNHCQPVSYTTCNATNKNNTICVTLTNCQNKLNVNFAYTGTSPNLVVCVSGPSWGRCGSTITYTCTVTNTGNVCFKGGNVCHTVGNCGWWGWNSSTCYTTTCPPLSPGEGCVLKQKCTLNWWNTGTYGCQSSVSCSQPSGGTSSGQSFCSTQVSW